MTVEQDLDLFDGDEPLGDHVIQMREKAIDLILRIDNLDDNREVFGES